MTDTQKRLVLKFAGICCLISGLALMTVGGLYVTESVLDGKNMGFLRWTTLVVGFFNTAAAVVILRIVAAHTKTPYEPRLTVSCGGGYIDENTARRFKRHALETLPQVRFSHAAGVSRRDCL